MATRVDEIAEQVKALPEDEREEFLSWLVDFETGYSDDWDKELARDSQPGGRLERVLERVRKDIAEGRTKPLDEYERLLSRKLIKLKIRHAATISGAVNNALASL